MHKRNEVSGVRTAQEPADRDTFWVHYEIVRELELLDQPRRLDVVPRPVHEVRVAGIGSAIREHFRGTKSPEAIERRIGAAVALFEQGASAAAAIGWAKGADKPELIDVNTTTVPGWSPEHDLYEGE